jgi:hypothetical protein
LEQVRIRLPDRNLGVAALDLPVQLRHALRSLLLRMQTVSPDPINPPG